jgi:hypothetical protein
MKELVVVAFAVCALACGNKEGANADASTPSGGGSSSRPGSTTALTGSPALTASPPSGMGMEAQRAMKTAQEKLAEQITELDKACGTSMSVEVDWASFGNNLEALQTFGLSNVGSQDTLKGIGEVCSDAIGKASVKQKMKKVVFKQVQKPGDKQLLLKDGAFRVTCAYHVAFDGTFSSSTVRNELEKSL